MLRLWPDPGSDPLTDEQIIHMYGVEPVDARPVDWLRVNFATSLDGAVTLDGLSAGLSGQEDKRVFGILRMLCDALVVGAGTVRDEGYRALRLSPERRAWRLANGLAEYPTLVVVSRTLDLDPAQAAFADAPVRPIVLTPRAVRGFDGAEIVEYGDRLADGLAELRARELRQILSEGGPTLFGALTAEDLVDELCLTVAPVLAGPGAGRITASPATAGPATAGATASRPLRLSHVLTGDGQLMLRHIR